MPSLREFRAQVDALLSAGTLFEAMDQYAIIFFNMLPKMLHSRR